MVKPVNKTLRIAAMSAGEEIGHVSGSIVTFRGNGDPLRSLVVNIDPVQDLHGYDSPWPAGGTKNKMPNAIPKTETINGVTFKLDEFGVFTVTGTATAEANCDFPIGYSFVIPDGDPKPKLALNNTQGTSATFKFFNNSIQIDSWGITPSYRTAAYSGMQGKTCNSYRISVPSGAVVNMTISPMIVENSVTDYTYIPYSNICPISGWTGAKVTRTGKNLADPADRTDTTYNVKFGLSDGILLKAGVSYTFSVSEQALGLYFRLYTDSLTALASAYNATKVVYTPTADTLVTLDAYYVPAPTGGTSVVICQLEVGSTATAYEPYQGETYDIEFPSEAGTVYGGTLDVTNGVLTVDRAMVDFDGSLDENWEYYAVAQGNMFRLPNYSAMKPTANIIPAISDAFKAVSQPNRANGTMSSGVGGSNIDFVFDGATSLAEWREWLAENNVQLCYELATPITIPLTPQEISTLQGANNVWADSGDSDVEYIATGGEGGKLALLLRNRKELLIALRKGLTPAEVGLLGSIPSFGGSLSPGVIRPGLNTQEEEEDEKDDA